MDLRRDRRKDRRKDGREGLEGFGVFISTPVFTVS